VFTAYQAVTEECFRPQVVVAVLVVVQEEVRSIASASLAGWKRPAIVVVQEEEEAASVINRQAIPLVILAVELLDTTRVVQAQIRMVVAEAHRARGVWVVLGEIIGPQDRALLQMRLVRLEVALAQMRLTRLCMPVDQVDQGTCV
jgi:hypothetical protein